VKPIVDDEAHVTTTAALVGLALSDERRLTVAAAFGAYRELGALLMSFPLPVEIEPASVYTLEIANDRE
jgi:hypothetical protein